jgi:hypothetical protein
MSAAIFRVSIALGVCAALINLLVWRQPIMAMADGHTSAFKVLYAIWFVEAWGVATGALTGLAISSMRRRSPGRLSAAVAFVVALLLTSVGCLVLYRSYTDPTFMHDAMSGVHPDEVNSHSAMPGLDAMPGMDMDMDAAHAQPARLNVVGALTPNFIAVALSVIYGFGGQRGGMRLLARLMRRGRAARATTVVVDN